MEEGEGGAGEGEGEGGAGEAEGEGGAVVNKLLESNEVSDLISKVEYSFELTRIEGLKGGEGSRGELRGLIEGAIFAPQLGH